MGMGTVPSDALAGRQAPCGRSAGGQFRVLICSSDAVWLLQLRGRRVAPNPRDVLPKALARLA